MRENFRYNRLIFIGHIAIQKRLSNPKVLSRVRKGGTKP